MVEVALFEPKKGIPVLLSSSKFKVRNYRLVKDSLEGLGVLSL